jgi:membrane-associated phospholipid phosphatase
MHHKLGGDKMFLKSTNRALRSIAAAAIACAVAALGASCIATAADDAILRWNTVAIQAVVDDHSGTFGPRLQPGPTGGSRALAIVHIAMFDAVNAIDGSYDAYHAIANPPAGASIDAAIAQAAHDTLVALYPTQQQVFDKQLALALAGVPANQGRAAGIAVGAAAALNILNDRAADGSAAGQIPIYQPTSDPPLAGEHQPDPLNPLQGLLGPGWGQVATFSDIDVTAAAVRAPPPPALGSAAYTANFLDVFMHGGDGIISPTIRTPEQTEIGLFWAYDGTKGLGVPPVLYNQITRVIAQQQRNTLVQNARLFALVNIAMADAGIACWDSKYFYNFWRPIVGIRNGDLDGNPDTLRVADWVPLCAPASNQSGNNFTPPFPSYPSGHATFGAALFRTLANFYGRDDIPFRFKSDEMSGRTTDNLGNHRFTVVRSFDTFTDAAIENARSRIYLGIHWQFDADSGIHQGTTIADHVFGTLLLPK